jgi:hypothetical protein
MSAEVPRQYDMFTDELDDPRTKTQKKKDGAREQPQQIEMFLQREVAPFGVRAKPQMSLTPTTHLVLISEDPRTPEEQERDLQSRADEQTHPMFDQCVEQRAGDAQDDEEAVVVDCDVFYTDAKNDPGMKPGWYFWFLDQQNNIVGDPIGPWESGEEAMRSGKVAVNVYYDKELR